jgi:anti-anti-sigma factor
MKSGPRHGSTKKVASRTLESMQAQFRKVQLMIAQIEMEVLVVHLSGQIDAESVDLFRQACRGPLGGRPVVFQMANLSIVGSSGLRAFLECLNNLTKVKGSDVRFCEVRNDLRHILEATPLGRRPMTATEEDAIESYRLSQGFVDFSLDG